MPHAKRSPTTKSSKLAETYLPKSTLKTKRVPQGPQNQPRRPEKTGFAQRRHKAEKSKMHETSIKKAPPQKNGAPSPHCKNQSNMNSAIESQIAIFKTARDIPSKKALAPTPVKDPETQLAKPCETSRAFWTAYAKTLRHTPRIGTGDFGAHAPTKDKNPPDKPSGTRILQTSFRES